MRRFLLIGTMAGLLALFAACSGSEADSAPTTTSMTAVAPTTTAAPARTTEVQAETWTENDLVFLTRREGGATLMLDMHFPADAADAPILIGGEEAYVDEGVIVVNIHEDDHVIAIPPGGPEAFGIDRAYNRRVAEEFACAIRFARAKAAELGNDDPVVLLSRFSLYGGFVAQIGLFGATVEERWDEFAAAGGPPRQFDCVVTDHSTHIDAVIGVGGTYDLAVPAFDGAYGKAFQREIDPELQEFRISPIGLDLNLKVRLIHGTLDEIPAEWAVQLTEVLTAAGYDAELITWPGEHEWPPDELYISTLREVLGR